MTLDELLGSHWVESAKRFKDFAERYEDKIERKFIDAQKDREPDEKLKDVLFEIEIAYLMLKTGRFSVEYEVHGEKGPDFTVTHETGIVFNVEVKRIRKTCEEKRLEAWRGQVAREVRAVPSTLAVTVNIGLHIDELSPLRELLDRLEEKKSTVIKYIVKTIHAEEENVPVDRRMRYPVPSFRREEVELIFSKPSRKPASTHTTFNGGIFPAFITRKEWEKFKDRVFPKNDQRIPGMINILAISTDSTTHGEDALAEEIEEDFKERVAGGNATEQMKKLSGILFRAALEPLCVGERYNMLWCNEIAYCPIPKDIGEVLKRMD
jgi:hypothetical protein